MKKILVILLVAMIAVGTAFAITACDDTKNQYKIGAQSATTGELYLNGDVDMAFAGFANIGKKTYDSIGQAVADMKNGNINCVVGDIEPAKAAVAELGGCKVIDIALSNEAYAIGVNKADSALLASINTILADIKADGTLAGIIANYNKADYVPTGVAGGTYDSNKAQFVIATNAEFAPFEYKQGENFVGIDIEIAKIIADELDMELVIKDMDFDSVVTSVGTNGVDAAMAGLTVKESRKVSVNFSDSYFTGSYQVLIVKDTDTTFDACATKADIEAILKNK